MMPAVKRKLEDLNGDDLKTLRVVVLGDKDYGITGIVARTVRIERIGALVLVALVLHLAAEPIAPGSTLGLIFAALVKAIGG